MTGNVWAEFGELIARSPRILATVHAHYADGTAGATTYDGAEIRVQGGLTSTPPYNAWIQDGRIVEAGPNLPLVSATV